MIMMRLRSPKDLGSLVLGLISRRWKYLVSGDPSVETGGTLVSPIKGSLRSYEERSPSKILTKNKTTN